MQHFVIFKQDGYYSGMPNVDRLADGRLVVGARVQTFAEHGLVGEWRTFVSSDDGATWQQDDDPTIPYNWPGSSPREKLERLERILPDGTYLCAGSVGLEEWPAERLAEVEALGLQMRVHPFDPENTLLVGGHKLFVQRSTDRGTTWQRRESVVPGVKIASGNRPPTYLADGTILYHVYTEDLRGDSYSYVWRSTDHGATWQLNPMGTHAFSLMTNETGMVEVSPGRVLAHSRSEAEDHDQRYLMERWSDDGGVTWTDPLRTDVWGYPAHLLKLDDGRILCSYGYRKAPSGVRAVLSDDSGQTWDLQNMHVLRDDGGIASNLRSDQSKWHGDVGYPVSIELDDGSILTVYYITQTDGVTHTAGTRWVPK